MTSYIAETTIHQNDTEFRCGFGWSASRLNPTMEDMVTHLTEILNDEDAFEDENYEDFNFSGLSPAEFARKLVENEEEMKALGTEWSIDVSSQTQEEMDC